eukprot:Colp12_sorted_trinity150504_noHs@35209
MAVSELLKEKTKRIHRDAESTTFMKRMLRGKVERSEYVRLLYSLYHVYKVMEEELQTNADHVAVRPIYFPKELNRADCLKEDISFYTGLPFEELEIPITPGTKIYIDRLRNCGQRPYLLAAHAYTRYLGDLSGGQYIAEKLRKTFQLDRESLEGVRFYHFENISDVAGMKNNFRQGLDNIPLTAEESQHLEEEAIKAFELNIELAVELDDGLD